MLGNISSGYAYHLMKAMKFEGFSHGVRKNARHSALIDRTFINLGPR